MQPIPTTYQFLEHQGLSWLVRVLPHLADKDPAQSSQEPKKPDFDPFLPYDRDLFVADISDTHVGLLNKFNVMDHHLLIVTRAFEAQETPLTLPDFAALGACLREFESFAFYNSGQTAGASQRHRHLQLVPLPLAPEGPEIPITPALAAAQFQEGVGVSPQLPFVHGIVRLDLPPSLSPGIAAAEMLNGYHRLLQAVKLQPQSEKEQLVGAYNLLATRRWMLIVPRTQAAFQSIAVNALGFAGTFLVRNLDQLRSLQDLGPMSVLRQVAVPRQQP